MSLGKHFCRVAFVFLLQPAAAGWFGREPPPAPPPPPPPFPIAAAAAILAIIVVALVVSIGYFAHSRWRRWKQVAIQEAFDEADADGSGKVDKDEFYSCVLVIYLTINQYGCSVRCPFRSVVYELYDTLNMDGGAEPRGGDGLDIKEFTLAIEVLLAQVFTRALTSAGFLFCCPVAASAIVDTVAAALEELHPYHGLALPAWAVAVSDLVPESVPSQVLTALFMLAMPWALKMLDRETQSVAKAGGLLKKINRDIGQVKGSTRSLLKPVMGKHA